MADRNIFLGNTSDKAIEPSKIYIGDANDKAQLVSKIYVGNESNKAVQVWPKMKWSDIYQKCEYLYNPNGTEWIRLDKKPDNNTRFILTFQYTSDNTQGRNRYLIGANESYRHWGLSSFRNDNNGSKYFTIEYYWYVPAPHNPGGPSIQKNFSSLSDLYGKHTLDFNRSGGYFYLDDVLLGQSQITFSDLKYTIALFGSGGSRDSYYGETGTGYIYSFKAYQGNELIYDLVPCYRKNDLKPGMYDFANDYFYTNAGSGEFYKGPDIN